MSYDVSVSFAGPSLNICSTSMELSHHCKIMFGHHVGEATSHAADVVTVELHDGQYTITSDIREDEPQMVIRSSLGEAMFELRERVQYLLSRNQRDYLIVHAGAAIVNGKLIVYPAASGSGKTTLSAWFIGQDATLLSDELIAVSPDGMVTGFAQALNVKAGGRSVFFEALGKSQKAVDLIQQPNGNAFVSWEQKLPVATWTKMDSFLLPKYQPDLVQDCITEPVSPAKVAAVLLENTINLRNFERMGLPVIEGLVTLFEGQMADLKGFGGLTL